MKIFLTVSLAILGLAAADISLTQGYNYHNQQSIYPLGNNEQQQPLIMQILNNNHISQQNRAPIQPLQITQPSQQYLPSAQQAQTVSSLPMPANFPNPATFQPNPVIKSGRRPRPRVKITKKPIVTKNFFIHSAPEESEDEIQDELAQLAQQPRKHYNVLFVKTPVQTSKAAALNLAKTLKEEKTVVYVLSKKTSVADLQDAIQDAPQQINKPEVFFIKYRTPEEAANAQRQIQSQYDSLGGTSIITDEGVAPITSVVGSLDAPEEEEELEEQQQQQQPLQQQQQPHTFEDQLSPAVNNANNQYLPPSQY